MANIELIINIVIICLLVPMIVFAYNLNKNLKTLRQNQNSLAQLVSALNEATFKAENSIPKLKSATEHSSHGLKEVVDNAKELKDDLLFINERADSLADRLENVISNTRNIAPTATLNNEHNTIKEQPASEAAPQNDQAMAELELLKALRAIK